MRLKREAAHRIFRAGEARRIRVRVEAEIGRDELVAAREVSRNTRSTEVSERAHMRTDKALQRADVDKDAHLREDEGQLSARVLANPEPARHAGSMGVQRP